MSRTTLVPRFACAEFLATGYQMRRFVSGNSYTAAARRAYRNQNGLGTSCAVTKPASGDRWVDEDMLALLHSHGVTLGRGWFDSVAGHQLGKIELGWSPGQPVFVRDQSAGHFDGYMARIDAGLQPGPALSDAEAEAAWNGTPVPSTSTSNPGPRTTVRTRKPRTPGGSSASTPAPAPAPAPKPTFTPFPDEMAAAMAVRTSRAVREGSAPAEQAISGRRAKVWKLAYTVLHRIGVSADAALDATFALVATDSLPDGERDPMRSVYQAATGRVVTQTAAAILSQDSAFAGLLEEMRTNMNERILPETALCALLLDARINVWAYGPAGSGKTHGLLQALRYIGHDDPVELQGNRHTEVSDLFGSKGLDIENGQTVTVFEDGGATMAARENRALLLDEFDLMPETVRAEARALLEAQGRRRITVKQTGEVLSAEAPIAAACNTLGLGEDPAYMDAEPVSAATRDRFVYVQFHGMEEDTLRALLSDMDADLDLDAFSHLIKAL